MRSQRDRENQTVVIGSGLAAFSATAVGVFLLLPDAAPLAGTNMGSAIVGLGFLLIISGLSLTRR